MVSNVLLRPAANLKTLPKCWRSSDVGEQIHKMAEQSGVKIICQDLPSLFVHNANPMEKFTRKLVLSLFELERDILVQRLYSGLCAKRAKSTRLNQAGAPKANGRKSTLEKLKPSKKVVARLKSLIYFAKALSLKSKKLTVQTVKRMASELRHM